MITVNAFVSEGINYWRILDTETGYTREQPQRTGDQVLTDNEGNQYIHYEPPVDTRPYLHVEVDGANIKPDGSWFLCNNGITFYLSIRLGPSLSDTLYDSFSGEFFALVRNRHGLDVYSRYVTMSNGEGEIPITIADLPPGTSVICLDPSDYSLVQLAQEYMVRIDRAL